MPPVSSGSRGYSSGDFAAKMIFDPRPDWYAAELPSLPATSSIVLGPLQASLNELHDHASALLKTENERYHSHHSASSSKKFLSTIMSSGTMSDKISALTLAIQESPLHTMKAMDSLVNLARKRNRGQAVSALSALKDLLAQGEILPPSRKLRVFSNQPQLLGALQDPRAKGWKAGQKLPGQLKEIHLIYWAFEDWLKTTYYEIIKLLEIWSNDEVEFARSRALGYVYELLTQKPEQEANLLRLLVNKLGDLDRKIASKASFLLLQLQTEHPLMKPIVISNIEAEILFRPRQSSHAKYCAVITLNQTVLSNKEEHVAVKLLEIYFSLFVALLKESEPSNDSRRANAKSAGKLNSAHDKRKKKKGRAKRGDLANTPEEESTQKMISAVLTGVNRAFPFTTSEGALIQNHLDMLFKITHSSNFNTSVQALMLLQQLSATRQAASDRFYRTLYESLLDPRLLTSSKQAMYLNVLFRALKADLNTKRVRAFIKRLSQVITLHQPAFVCGALYLIKELEETFPSLHALVTQPESYEDEEGEIFQDVPDEPPSPSKASGVDPDSKTMPHGKNPKILRYDARKRDPEHSKADMSCLWELIPLLAHFHPSVTLFASRILHNESKPPKPDLSLHNLIHFLDRFVYRNAKSAPTPRGASIMQPLAGGNEDGILLSKRDNSRTQAPLNSAQFLAQKPEDVSVDEVFFHKYFSQVGTTKKISENKQESGSKKRTRGKDEDDDDDDDDEIWKALVGSRPELEGSEDGEDDLSLDEMDTDEDADEVVSEEESPTTDLSMFDSDDEQTQVDEQTDPEERFTSLFPDEDDDVSSPESLSKSNRKRDKTSEATSRRQKKRKLKHLPTFASMDDYADMLKDDEDGME